MPSIEFSRSELTLLAINTSSSALRAEKEGRLTSAVGLYNIAARLWGAAGKLDMAAANLAAANDAINAANAAAAGE